MEKFTGKQYLMIDIANNFGKDMDKKDWSERLAWFEQNESNLTNLVNQAEEPALFYAGVQAWEAAKNGQPSGYPISLDATSSGLQILAVLTGDRNAAQICNVVNTGHRCDAYNIIYQDMVNELGESARIKRSDTKDAIMTSLYGSTAIPKEIFGEGILLKTFFAMMVKNAPAAWELNRIMLEIWNPEAYCNSWVLPDNFHVHVKVMKKVKEVVHFMNAPVDTFYNVNEPTPEGRSLGANTIHSIDGMIVREMTRRCDYNPNVIKRVYHALFNAWEQPHAIEATKDTQMVMTLWGHYKKSGFLSARILDHLNEDNIFIVDRMVIQELIDSLPPKPFNLISVHD